MKQVDNTDIGPVIVCDGCFDALKTRYEGKLIFEGVTQKVPPEQICDMCGVRAVGIFRGTGGKLTLNGLEVADVISFEGMTLR